MKRRRKLILCIDNSVLVLGILGRALEAKGFRVLSRDSGQAGLSMMGTTPVDAVIVDLEMAGDGVNLARRIRATRKEIPIILFSGETPELLKELPREFDYFVRKPDLRRLVSLVMKTTAGRSRTRPS
jgi:CheY-like chemotaxis protein